MTRIRRDSIAYVAIIAFAVLMLAWAIPTYSPPYPGYGASPGLVPTVAIALMLVMTCIALAIIGISKYLKKPLPKEESEYPDDAANGGGFTQVGKTNKSHIAKIMLPCVFFVIAIQYMGYIPSALLFLAIIQYAMGSRRWIQIMTVSVVLTILLFIVMRYGFSVPVPGPQLF